MKICHMTSVHTPFDTRIFHKECKSLASAGYDVHLITRHDRDETIDGITIHAVPAYASKIRRMISATHSVYKKAVDDTYDVYHFHDPELIPFGLLLKMKGKRVIYDVHEDYPVYFRYKEAFPRLLRMPLSWIISIIERCSAGRFDALVTVTPTIYERFTSLNESTVLIRNFPFTDEYSSVDTTESLEPKSDTVVYVGSLTLDRGVKEMVQAVGLMRKRHPVRLILAGDFGSESHKQIITNMPEFSSVDYRGHTSREDTISLLAQARIGMALCHPHPHYQRAYPTKLFEYMLAGIPVIASNFPMWRAIVEDAECGLTVDSMKPEEIAEAVAYLLSNPQEAERMGKLGKEAAQKKYNWKSEESVLLDIYKKITSK